MNKIKDALGLGSAHHSHKNASTVTAENCPECATAARGTTTSTSTYATGNAPASTYGSSSTMSSDNAMTRSEEQLLVGKERVDTGAAALKKTITSEHVETQVPLVQEKVVLQREPITDANRQAAYSGAELKESEHVVTTHAERPVVAKETVAKERVSLGKVQEVVNQPVGGEIRKENITLEQQGAPMASTTGTVDPMYNKDTSYSTSTTASKTAY